MINQLFDHEKFTYGGQEAQKIAMQIADIRDKLSHGLDKDNTDLLQQLENLYIQQDRLIMEDAFIEGFCAMMSIIAEFLCRKSQK